MTNYNDGEWHLWNGGECPVHPNTEVEVVSRDRGIVPYYGRRAGVTLWTSPEICAFRVVKEYREPREFWVNIYDNEARAAHASKSDADKAAASYRVECIHVREVL